MMIFEGSLYPYDGRYSARVNEQTLKFDSAFLLTCFHVFNAFYFLP